MAYRWFLTMRLSASVLGVALAAVLVEGCASALREEIEFRGWENALVLSVSAFPSVLNPGTKATFGFVVRNRGSGQVEACIGNARRVTTYSEVPVPGRSFLAQTANLNAHPRCEQRL